MDHNGWVTIEFMLVTAIILLTIPSIISIIEVRMDAVESTHELVDGRILAETIAESVEAVYYGGEGHYIMIEMPPDINHKTYIIIINSNGVFLKLNHMMGVAFITHLKIANNSSKEYISIFMHPNKTYRISNVKDEHGYNYILIQDENRIIP